MSGDITENCDSFGDPYKTDNLDDSELQSRLYAEIYYDSNFENESGTTNDPRTIRYDNMVFETNVELERLQNNCTNDQSSASTIQDSQKIQSTELAEVNMLSDREMNPVIHGCNNESPEKLAAQRRNKQISSKKFKSSKHAKNVQQERFKEHSNDLAYSKYNVVSKFIKQKNLLAKQTEKDNESSDSEESIFEVPVPPKPKPLLIDLQDSDDENNLHIDKDDLILKDWRINALSQTYSKKIPSNHDLEVSEVSNDQDASFINKNTTKSHNKDSDENSQTSTCAQEVAEDIVLNCTTIQRGAKNISEIKRLSKSTGINQESKSIEETNQNSKSRSPQNKSKRTNENNLQQEMSVTSGKKSQMRTQQNIDKTSGMESSNPILSGKRQSNEEIDSQPNQKRQCTVQQNNQDVILQGNSRGEKSNTSSNKFFNQLSEEMRTFYNSSRGQENFDVNELQRSMSKDPRKWAILDEDLMPCPAKKQRTRFWNVKCNNCHKDGHLRYNCPSPRRPACCYMCGKQGHTEFRCSEKMCLTCGKRQNTFRNTCEHCRVLYCTMCNSAGHELKQCPDLWRRYHQITDMNKAPQNVSNVMKPSRLLYCCNCTKRGHESSTCRELPWSEHFPTPAGVTNYMDGPTYVPRTSSSSGPDPESDFLPLETRENETSNTQNATNLRLAIERAIIEDVEPADENALSSSADFCVSSTLQETAVISQMEKKYLEESNIFPTLPKNQKKQNFNISKIKFNKVIHSYGTFHNTDHNDAGMILTNLSSYYKMRKLMLTNLKNGKIAPNFLSVLCEKAIDFEVKIGLSGKGDLFLQLLAMKDYIELLNYLLKYWFNLLDEEKDYGIDVSLPTNPTKMYNLLSSRMPQLEKMCFTSYAEHIGGINDPRCIFKLVQHHKKELKKWKGVGWKEYNNLRTKLNRLQIKLLMITNTHPKPKEPVQTFRKMMTKFASNLRLMGDNLDIVTYIRLIILYNKLFVPHIPGETFGMLKCFTREEKKMKGSMTPTLDKNPMHTVYSTHEESCPSQNIEIESSFAINNQQNNEISVDGQNEDNISSKTSKTTEYICDDVTTIRNSTIFFSDFQDSQIFTPINTEPTSIQLQNPGKIKDQLSTSEVNIKTNVSAPSVSTNKQKKTLNDILNTHTFWSKKEKRIINKSISESTNMCDIASNLVKRAHTFNVPHMKNAANEVQKHINNQTIKSRHVLTLFQLIVSEENYQKKISAFCKVLK